VENVGIGLEIQIGRIGLQLAGVGMGKGKHLKSCQIERFGKGCG
jgi:hypothetical protein